MHGIEEWRAEWQLYDFNVHPLLDQSEDVCPKKMAINPGTVDSVNRKLPGGSATVGFART